MGILKAAQLPEHQIDDHQQMAINFSAPNIRLNKSKSGRILKGVSMAPKNTVVIPTYSIQERHSQYSEGEVSPDIDMRSDDPLIDSSLADNPEGSIDSSPSEETLISEPPEPESPPPTAAVDMDDYILKTEHELALKTAHEDGHAKGREEGEQALKPHIDQLLSEIDQLLTDKEALFAKAEPAVLQLALDVAKKIIQTELSLDDVSIQDIVTDCLTRLSDADKVIIRAHHSDAEKIRNNVSAFKSQMPNLKEIVIQEDPTIEEGGILLETEFGYMDATLTYKLSQIKDLFDRAYAQS